MFEWMFALTAAIAWAISAPIVDTGMKKAKGLETPLLGLLVSLLTGLLILTPALFFELGRVYGEPWKIALAGIFTFPIGTFLYYFAVGKMTAKRAVPVANVKPLFSVFLAALLLGEPPTQSVLLALLLVICGLACLWVSGPRRKSTGRRQQNALFLFIIVSVPLAWALGEISMGAGLFPAGSRLLATYMALAFGALAYLIILGLAGRRYLTKIRKANGLRWFALHGIISFGIGYFALFTSIGYIGVARTAIIAGIWPLLALPFSVAGEKLRGEKIERRAIRWIALAAGLIFIGAMVCTELWQF
jgi:drug/metabolite transporter (DMT)-like permease